LGYGVLVLNSNQHIDEDNGRRIDVRMTMLINVHQGSNQCLDGWSTIKLLLMRLLTIKE